MLVERTCRARDTVSIPGQEEGSPLPVFLPREASGLQSIALTKSDITKATEHTDIFYWV